MSAGKNHHPVTWVTDSLGVGPAPMSHAALDDLWTQGVRAILNLCAEFTDLHDIEAGHGFEVYHLPVDDEQTPELAELEKALDWLDEAIYLGKKVFIHCRHGIGRTGTVLNAYILRRGLGHRRAWLRLRTLRSQPANFRQWRMVRRYGKGAVPLTLRTPTLEHRRGLDLEPFYADYRKLPPRVEEALAALANESGQSGQSGLPCCGRDHARCCSQRFDMTLVEAVHLNASVNASLSRADRQAALLRAAGSPETCPLLQGGRCLAFDQRPLRCRLADLSPDLAPGLAARLQAELEPALAKGSREIYHALTGKFMPRDFPRFSVAEAISGRHVQAFFNWQRQEG